MDAITLLQIPMTEDQLQSNKIIILPYKSNTADHARYICRAKYLGFVCVYREDVNCVKS